MSAQDNMTGWIPTCDLCDDHKADSSGDFRVLPPIFESYGGQANFAGPVLTIQCFEDNSFVKSAVESNGEGRVLVVDGGASLKKALVGGNLAATAARNGWAGIVVYGAVRDVRELRASNIGIRALALIPMPTEKKNVGEVGVDISIAGTTVRTGEWLYADEDGIVVSAKAIH